MMRQARIAVTALVAVVAMALPSAVRAHVVLGTDLTSRQETPELYIAKLDTAQEVPPTTVGPPSPTGLGRFALNADKTITYSFTTQNLSGPATAAHLHEAPVGVSNPAFAVALDVATGAGTTSALTDDQVVALRAGNLYVNVHTSANPGGEIRGQLIVPTGTATFEFDPETSTLDYTITTTNLSGAVTAAHLHLGPPGVAGGVKVTLDNSLLGSVQVTPDVINDLYDGNLYANVHTALNPNGEIRGQVAITGDAECHCSDGTRKAYLRCVAQKIRALDKADRKLASVKAIKKAAKLSSCGRTKGPKKAVACCLPQTPTENIVLGRQCAPIPERVCTKKNGLSLGVPSTCFPTNPCTPPASPSGAFVDLES